MTFVIEYDLHQLKDLKGRISQATEEMQADILSSAKIIGEHLVMHLQGQAPQKTGQFAQGIESDIETISGGAAIRTYSPKPLGNFILMGTRPHKIAARNANALYFFWPKVGMDVIVPRDGGFTTHIGKGKLWIGKGYVDHPGTRPNDFVGRAFRIEEPEIEFELTKISENWVKKVVGAYNV